jgi:hypothetical protein
MVKGRNHRSITLVASACLLLTACTSQAPSGGSQPPSSTRATSSDSQSIPADSPSKGPGVSQATVIPSGKEILSLSGKGNSQVVLPKLRSSVKGIGFQVQCSAGTFAMISKGKDLFGGDCAPGGKYSARVPLRLINVQSVSWLAAPDASWSIQAWVPSS